MQRAAQPTAPAAAQALPERDFVRNAMRVREAGRLDEAVEMLRTPDPYANVTAEVLRWKLLYELQDYAELQPALHRFAATPARLAEITEPEALCDFMRFAERSVVPPEPFDACLSVISRACRADVKAFEFWRAATRRSRQRVAIRATNSTARVMSLGLNCLPWHLPGRWGFRQPRDFVDLFGPFSLAAHKTEGVITAIASDFEDYAQPEALRTIRSANGHEMAIRKDRIAGWNHVRGTFWLGDDYARLRAFLAAQAERFRAACRDPAVVFVLGTCPVEYPTEPLTFLPQLQEALSRHTGTLQNRIFVSNQTARERPQALHRVDDTVFFAYSPYPSPDYVWHDDDAANTPDGFVFEQRYGRMLLRALTAWGLAEAPPPVQAGTRAA